MSEIHSKPETAWRVTDDDRKFAANIIEDFGDFEEGVTNQEKLAQWVRNIRCAAERAHARVVPAQLKPSGPVQGWEVEVRINGVSALTIGHNHLAGIENIQDYAETVKNCARHLWSFIDGRAIEVVGGVAGACSAIVMRREPDATAGDNRTDQCAAPNSPAAEALSPQERPTEGRPPVAWLITYADGQRQYRDTKPKVMPTPDSRLTPLYASDDARGAVLEEAATIAEFFNDGAHVARDIREGIFPRRSHLGDAIAEAIRARRASPRQAGHSQEANDK